MANGLDYEKMMERALREIVRAALAEAAGRGLPGQHHFYVTFRTAAAGVVLPPHLRQRYPDEMTIVLQYQFWGLEVGDEEFKVTLSFDGKHERLTIPFDAVAAFADPSVQFGLQFPARDADGNPIAAERAGVPAPAAPTAEVVPIAPAAPADPDAPPAGSDATPAGATAPGALLDIALPGERVVKLDKFRRK